MVVAPLDALSAQDALPMPTPLAWVEAPLVDRIRLLRQGVPASWVRQAEEATDLGRSTLCALLGLKLSTINRKLNQKLRLSPDESERLMGLQRLIGEVEAVVRDCGDGQGFAAGRWLASWLQRPNQALGGSTPASYLDTAEGREQLGRLIGAQRSGAYV
jgi:putative toxin-antitoxin system antitoxin component (TIGR02293 family)